MSFLTLGVAPQRDSSSFLLLLGTICSFAYVPTHENLNYSI